MNNTTILDYDKNSTETHESYLSKLQWFAVFRLYTQQWIEVSLIPIGIIGILFNILALVVMRSDRFTLPFYTYLRAFTIASIFICFMNATQFTAGARSILNFTNSKISFGYYCFIFYPLQVLTNVYGSFLDVVLSLERVLLLSNMMNWFKKINPKILCLIFFLISTLLTLPYWFYLDPTSMTVYLNKTTPFTIHYPTLSAYFYYVFDYTNKLSYVTEIVPIVFEVVLNTLSIYAIKKYTKNKRRITTNRVIKIDSQKQPSASIAIRSIMVPSTTITAANRAKRTEVKLTILVIFMSLLSIM
jgi:hypothetical protein